MKNFKKAAVLAMTGIIAMTGICVTPLAEVFTNEASVALAAGKTYNTQGGIATMGTGSASVSIYGNDGQTLEGKKFHIYKLFDAENSKDGESINYTMNAEYAQALKNVVANALTASGKKTSASEVTEYMIIDYIQTLNSNPVEGTQANQTLEGRYSLFRYFIEDLRDELVTLGLSPDTVNVNNTKSDNSIQIKGLAYGYYIIDEVTDVDSEYAASSLCLVDTANPTASINIKSDYPSVIKKIQEDDNETDWNDIGDYEIGQTVPYKYESNIPDMNGYDTYYYAWHDVMDSALTFNKDSVQITITGKTGTGATKSYILDPSEYRVVENPGNGDTFQITVSDIKKIVDKQFNQMNDNSENIYGQSVLVTYNATLNDTAAYNTGRPGFENDVRLEFSNDADSDGEGSTGFTPWDTVVCFTYQLDVLKTNNNEKVLEGAKFRLYSDKECTNEVYVKQGSDGNYIVINRDLTGGTDHTGGKAPGNAVEMVSSEDGTFIIYGLDQGTYYLKETDSPAGYRELLDPIVLTITPTFTTERDSYVKGQGATDATLKTLTATAHMESFWDGIVHTDDTALETDVASGTVNLTVVNQVGVKLPVTGTSAAIIIFAAGVGLMTVVIVKSRKKNER